MTGSKLEKLFYDLRRMKKSFFFVFWIAFGIESSEWAKQTAQLLIYDVIFAF